MRMFLPKFLLTMMLVCFASSIAEAQKTKSAKKNSVAAPVKKAAAPPTLSALELGIAAEINRARTEPQKIVALLEDYRKHLKGGVLALPGKTALQMIEGAPAIDDAIADLREQARLKPFEISAGLSRVARGHLIDLLENPKLKHFGKDGSDLERRMLKIGFAGDPYAENISYQADTALDVLMNMIIDDGIKSRSHRKNIFSEKFNLLGVACGATKDKSTICVAEFANSFKER